MPFTAFCTQPLVLALKHEALLWGQTLLFDLRGCTIQAERLSSGPPN